MSIDDSGKRTIMHASVPEELAQGLKAIAVAQDRSLGAELRRAVAEHIAQHEHEREDST